ncbi:MAG: hypothetical protein QOJ32_2466, partial [Frankiaceae bacterium]|nr:hypothetical protein [Frankiaceae bacterium]
REMRLIETVLAGAFGVATSLGNDPRDHAPQSHSRLLRMVERGIELVGNYLRPLAEGSDLLRRQIYLVDILLACVRGVLADGLLVLGTDVVDDVDFTDWLEHHGAAPESARCALIRAAVYDLAFAYRNGDTEQPSCSAATALRGLARMVFDYKGSLAYKMRAGMGETVFAPIYLALLRRGVRFEFFHNVTRLELSADASRIERVHIAQQAPLRPQGGEWPLRTVQGMHCWQPAPPAALVDSVPAHLTSDPQQLGWQLMYGDGVGGADACDTGPSGAASRDVVLESGEHFTDVVLAISLGALRHVCRDLIDVDWRWREMVEQVATVGTQSLQLWFENSTADLGDPVPGAITCGFVDPFDTYADMSHLLEWESWEKPAPRAVAYFCSALPWEQEKERVSLEQQQSANEHVRRHAIRFLEKDLGSLLPSTTHRYPSGFRWDSLIPTATGAEGFERQYLRANIDPSDRYVQSLPGTSRYRLRPDDSGFANLYLAGDWTDCGLNAGCIEAAATAGLLAARAICRSPATSAVVGHDHLRRPR